MQRRLTTAAALSAMLLLGACTEKAPQPPPPPTSYPPLTAEPASSSPTPTSSEATTQHSDLLEIQDLYKTEFAAETQVLKHGGTNKLPADIQKRTTNPYQQVVLDSFQAQKKDGGRLVAGGKIIGVAMGKWTPTKVSLQACEDYTGVRSVDRHGNVKNSGPGARTVQTYVVVKIGESWRIKDSRNKDVKNFTHSPCNGTWYS